MDSKCDAFSFLSFFIFPSFFKPPAAGSPCCGRFAFDRELPVVSFRGAKRRGNLWQTISNSPKSTETSVRFCKIAPQGCFLALRPSRGHAMTRPTFSFCDFAPAWEKAQREFFANRFGTACRKA